MKKELGFRIKVSLSGSLHPSGVQYNYAYSGFVPFDEAREDVDYDKLGEEFGTALEAIHAPRAFLTLADAILYIARNCENSPDLTTPTGRLRAAAQEIHDKFLIFDSKSAERSTEELMDEIAKI